MPKHYRPPGKKKEGNAAKYITRTKAVHYLQVSLSNFRKLCILKGIFPREPKKKVEGNHKTYYHMKDILFLAHEPLLEKFRDIRAHKKKVKKALARKNRDLADRLLNREPTYKLDRLILESHNLDFHCGSISKAEVEGQKITWLTPHALQQVLTDDVDFNVMLTFSEFYVALLGFVNFKLYHSINVKYPPILDPRLEALAAELYALCRYISAGSGRLSGDPQAITSVEDGQHEVEKTDTRTEESELRLAQLQHQLSANEPGALMHLMENTDDMDDEDHEKKECRNLFRNLKFFLSREVPRESLLFVIPAFGGVVSWDGNGSPFKESAEDITHQIVDRPTQGHVFLSREYVQPQWVYDCINARIILPTEKYLVGRVPPPHLSPFVDNEAEGYIPEYAETIKRLQAAAKKQVLPMPGVESQDLDDPQTLLVEGIIDRTEANEAAEKKRKLTMLEKQYHDELNMELQGITYSTSLSNKNLQSSAENVKEDTVTTLEESEDLSKVSMSRKKRKLYEAMKISYGFCALASSRSTDWSRTEKGKDQAPQRKKEKRRSQ
ncbi:Pescadillo N-terminus [Musa troglodytarum]|uniref:Pescadillo N-terminus n=1 Tax=Musa troglodytarum TaxID=320322 RepID=A0A9E7L102_9LILI|nr:Pescadillo N-terminus [Musa troglodytarum]